MYRRLNLDCLTELWIIKRLRGGHRRYVGKRGGRRMMLQKQAGFSALKCVVVRRGHIIAVAQLNLFTHRLHLWMYLLGEASTVLRALKVSIGILKRPGWMRTFEDITNIFNIKIGICWCTMKVYPIRPSVQFDNTIKLRLVTAGA